jgi:hypothetical protein
MPAEWVERGPFVTDGKSKVILQLDKLSEIVERDDPSLPSLEAAIDVAVGFIANANVLSNPENSPRGISIGQLSELD